MVNKKKENSILMVIAYNFSYDLSFPINASCNWKVETVAENPNSTN